MFNLEKSIQTWKRNLRRNPAFEDGDIAELESHLRDEIERLKAEGLSEEKAFNKALEEIGEPEPIGEELYKSRATQKAGPVPPWKQASWIPSLFPNYIKVVLRTYKRNPTYSSINILALSVALSVSLLVITFVKDQADYDAFHKKADQIYRVITTSSTESGSSVTRYASSPYELAPIFKSELPEVIKVSRLQPVSDAAVFENERLNISGFKADSLFFDLFDFELAAGNAETALDRPHSMVLSRETAERFFGITVNPLGKFLRLADGQDYEITGVLSARTYRSHLEFDVLLSTSGEGDTVMGGSSITEWQDPKWYTYFLVRPEFEKREVELKLQQIAASYFPGELPDGYRLGLQKVTKINLGERLARQIGRITPIEFVYFLSALAILVMLAACINYVNLTVARSMRRAEEIGLRKVIGASRSQLVGQFLSESLVTAFFSLVLGLLFFWGWLLPFWNSLRLATADFGRIAFDTSRDPELYLFFIGFALLVGLFSGLYPALKLSAHSPARALKGGGMASGKRGWPLRKVLIVFQVALSLIMLISTFLLYRQSDLLLNADYGFAREGVINVDLGMIPYESFRRDALNQAGVSAISATSFLPGVEFPIKKWAGKDGRSDSISVSFFSVDAAFVQNFEVDMVAGRNFSRDFSTDTSATVLINETAAEQLGFEHPQSVLGSYLSIKEEGGAFQIIGVVEDFQFDFLWNPISPLVLRNDPAKFQTASIKLEGTNHDAVLANLEKVWQKHEAIAPFDYRYYSTQIDNVYNDFEELVGIIAFLSVLAVLIASFGLLAMAHYDTQTRIKEIGVRKVLGAQVQALVWLLSFDFLKMVGVATLIGVPAAVYINGLWLQVFSYKAHFGTGIILIGVIITIVLTVGAIGIEAYKAAVMNPVKSLKSE